MTTVLEIQRFKREGRRFAMLTAYDATTARLLDQAGIPILLVGDTLAMAVLGHSTTLPVTLEAMIHHTAAVARGNTNAMIVGDLPFMSYQISTEQAVESAGRMLKEGGAHAVKLEGTHSLEAVERLTSIGIPVMGHVGLTPQSVHQVGGFKVQGRSELDADQIKADALALERAGAFSVVLEALPSGLAQEITRLLTVPTIGIGAGPHCDGQVLVINDLLGLTSGHLPRFVKPYADLSSVITRAVQDFASEVASGEFPDPSHSYTSSPSPKKDAET
ncbi:MAG TPA: 3-methyl-2-oxobutanoate hydroxymethyltransferase [Candidatus Dormibacteraeota bacterium]|nr:3-methyl-2-oxobutanoate hydroxymethyltransferase [Candidatus Dormibacteraeota bacterium]